MNLNLDGQHALVCGASAGIGRAAAHELALLGADVTVLSRRAEALRDIATALPLVADGQHHGWIAADATQPETLRAAAEALAATRPVHILINNSGGPPAGHALDAGADAYLAAFQQHLLANHALVQALAPGMKATGWGRIVNVISTSVKEPIAHLGVSNSIRGAVASWAKTLSRELGPFAITVNNVLPGYTRTDRLEQIVGNAIAATGKSREQVEAAMLADVPAARFADPEEVAAAIAFLASPAAAYINGVSVAVDGGRMHSL